MDCGCGGGGGDEGPLGELNPDALAPGWSPDLGAGCGCGGGSACGCGGACNRYGGDAGGDVDFPHVPEVTTFSSDPCETARRLYQEQHPGKQVECQPKGTVGPGSGGGPVVISVLGGEGPAGIGGEDPDDMGACLCWVVDDLPKDTPPRWILPEMPGPIELDPELPELPDPRPTPIAIPGLGGIRPKDLPCLGMPNEIPEDEKERYDNHCKEVYETDLEEYEAALARGETPPPVAGGPCAHKKNWRWSEVKNMCVEESVVCGTCMFEDPGRVIDLAPGLRLGSGRR